MLAKLSVDQALLKAKSYAKKGEIAEAQKVYQLILKTFSKNQRAIQGLTSLENLRRKNTLESLPQEIINELLKLYDKRQFSSVFEKAQVLTKQYSDSFILWNILGVAAGQIRKFEEAIDAFMKSISLKPDYAEAYSNMGNVLKDQGKLNEAIKAYKKSITFNPDYTAAYFNIGIALKDMGNFNEAIKSFKKVILIKPSYAEAYNNLGIVLADKGKLDEAIQAYKKYISLKPDNAFAYYNFGNALQKQGKLDCAIEAYKQALTINPKYTEAFCNMGVALQNQGNFDEAIVVYKKSISIKPNYEDAHHNIGLILLDQGKLDQAITVFKKVISINANNADAYNNMAIAFKNQCKFDESIESCERALKVKPDYAEAYNNLGVALKNQGKLEQAIDAFMKSISLKPDYAEAYSNMGITFKDQGKLDEAIIASKKSTSLKPDHAEAYSNMGNILQNQGKLDEAIEAYKKSIMLDPNLANAHKNLSFALLNCGKYQEGFDEYEWRWKTDENLSKYRHFRQPEWNRETSLNGKTIFIWSEQGVGDTINWSSCLSYITTQAKHCILECQEKLVPLLKRSFPNVEVKAENTSLDAERDDFDFHLSMGSLYKNLSREILQNTKVDAYLEPDPDRVKYWKERLNSLGNGPYIGISWKSILMTPGRIPNYAPISEWAPLLTIPNVKLINLQPKDFKQDLDQIKFELGVTVHNFDDIDHWDDLEDVAALCTALDMVVSNKITVPLIAAGVGTLTKLANWKQSAWNNILLNPKGPSVQIYERNTWETWENVFNLIAEDILKLKNMKKPREISRSQNPPSEVINKLLSLFNNGQFLTVLEQSQALIEKYPKAFDVWNILGASAYKTSMMDKAIKAYKEVTLLKPDFAAGYNNLAVALIDQGEVDEAIEICNKVISLNPNYIEAYKNLGDAYKNQRKFDDSIKAYKKAISLNPDYAEVYNNLGNAYQDNEKLHDSIKAYEKAILLKPHYAQAYNNLGNALNDVGKLDEAIKTFKKALLLKPDDASIYNNMGVVLADQGKLDESNKAFKKALLLNPDYADAYNNIGKSLIDQGKLQDAMDAFKKALLLKPNHPYAYNNIGSIFRDQGKLVEAIDSFQKAILINPNFALAFNNMGVTLKDQGKMNEAIDAFNKALSLKPSDSVTHKNLGYTLLNCGRLQEGLDEYEWRWGTPKLLPQKRNFLQSMWDGKQSLNGKRILLWCEQGIGDTITWSSRLPLIVSQAKHCILECQPKLVPLLKRSFPNITVKAEDRSVDLHRDDFDLHLPMGSLYKNFIQEISITDKSDAYLIPDPDRVDYWRNRLSSLGTGPFIGISWKSSNLAPERLPHYATISDLSPVLRTPNVTFINLQYVSFEEDLNKISNELGIEVHNFDDLDHYNDIDDVAALCLSLDLVVSTKTTVPFISAGVGTSTKLANWKQSPWNNVLSNLNGPKIDVFERDTLDPWDNVFTSIAHDILKYTNKRRS